ncbi:MAG: sugar ABC transporter permease [Gammaproteobacteria bacterium]|nr:MAG: sugar ABC transporter permease [Gammaproteobacteria bacterium]
MAGKGPGAEAGGRAPRSPELEGFPEEARAARWLVLPALLGLALFVLLPFLGAVGLSLTDLRLGSPHGPRFVGLAQYRRLLEDPAFWAALRNNALFAAGVVPVQTGLALLLALGLRRRFPGRAPLRTLLFLPVVFPMALVAVMWTVLYAPGPRGAVNAFLATLSLGAWEPRDFLHDPAWALPAVMLTSVWQGVGFQMVVLLAGLQAIPRELYEAARVDGAGPWGQFLHVTLPGLRNPLLFVVLVTAILAFRVFDQIQIMTQGGPGLATTTLMYEAVRAAYVRQQLAQGAAISVVFFLLVLGLTLAQRRLLRQREVLA